MCYNLKNALKLLPTKEENMSEGSKKAFEALSNDIEDMDLSVQKMRDNLQALDQDVKLLKNDVSELKISHSEMHGKIDTVIELIKSRLDSPIEKERLVGATINSIISSKKAWIAFIFLIFLVALSGISVMYLVDHAESVSTIVTAIK